jgi:hypothetical protein
MKLFPNKSFKVKLIHDRATSLNNLKEYTKLTNKLVSVYTDKEFIGQVDDCRFEIISCEIGRGAVCVFLGELQDSIGTVEIQIHKAFKVIFSILMVMPVIGFGVSVAMIGIEHSLEIGVAMIVEILFVRFVFIELSFCFISRIGLNKLIKIVGINVLD